MNTKENSKISYFFIDEKDLFINKNEKVYDNTFLMHINFWNTYAKVKESIESIKRNNNLKIEKLGLSNPNLNGDFDRFNIPSKYKKFIIAIFNNSPSAYELTTRSEFDLTFETMNINGHTFVFGKNIEHSDLYAFFELKSVTENEAMQFKKELIDNDYYEDYKKIANNLFKEKNLVRKQVRN